MGSRNNSPSLSKPNPRVQILASSGSWWFVDQARAESILLNTIIQESNWRVAPVCLRLGIEVRTFQRIVESCLGISPKRWLRGIRIIAACQQLIAGEKVEATAKDLGFRHHSDFTAEFKS